MKEYSVQGSKRNSILGLLVVMYLIMIFLININLSKYVVDLGAYAAVVSILSISPLFLALLTMKLPLFMRLSNIPNISGIYEGHTLSSFSNYKNETLIIVTITQNIFRIDIKMETETSVSHSLSADIEKRGNDVILMYIYQNDGNVTQNLTKHGGVCTLFFEKDTARGEYYSSPERKTNGRINLVKIPYQTSRSLG